MQKWKFVCTDACRRGTKTIELAHLEVNEEDFVEKMDILDYKGALAAYDPDFDLDFIDIYLAGLRDELLEDRIRTFSTHKRFYCNELRFERIE